MTLGKFEKLDKKGWYLVDARLPEGRSILSVWAVAVCEGIEYRIPLPASFKGRVFELIPRPASAHSMHIEARDENGGIDAALFSVRTVPTPVALYWMWHRLLGGINSLRPQLRRRLRIGWSEALRNPYRTYRSLGSLRYHFPEPDYVTWCDRYWNFDADVKERLLNRLETPAVGEVCVSVLLDDREASEAPLLEGALESIAAQVGKVLEVHRLSDSGFDLDQGSDRDWILFMTPSQRLEPWACAWIASEAVSHPQVQLIYSDHACLDEHGTPIEPRFKPDWSPEFQQVSHYAGNCIAIRRVALKNVRDALGGMPDAYQALLEFGAVADERQVLHIPAVLWHQVGEETGPDAEQLVAHFGRQGINAHVAPDERGNLRVRYDLPGEPPRISIVIPTRDMLHFLEPCVTSILEKSTWPDFEVLIVDNQSTCPKTLAYMQAVTRDSRVRVLKYDKPFNFSAINNFAVEHATGDLVCLLNNDTEVIGAGWLEEMATRLLRPGVGAVGARLYFDDGRIQHAGDVVGPGGCANHLHGILDGDDPGYMNRAVLPQELSAVTAACLLTHRSVYQQLGGLDEHNLTVAFNDVDFCLRIREAGYRVIYTPYAELYHYESVSRGKDDNPEKRARAKREVQYMRERWSEVIARDPFYNPNLNYARPDFTLGKYPRIDWPW